MYQTSNALHWAHKLGKPNSHHIRHARSQKFTLALHLREQSADKWGIGFGLLLSVSEERNAVLAHIFIHLHTDENTNQLVNIQDEMNSIMF